MTRTNTKRAVLRFTAHGGQQLRINYSRRMYAIIRRYTPDVIEGKKNECYADITGLRTFFKMTYAEIATEIKNSLAEEIGVRFILHVTTLEAFNGAKTASKKPQAISTYKEMSILLSKETSSRGFSVKTSRPRLCVPFLGRVS